MGVLAERHNIKVKKFSAIDAAKAGIDQWLHFTQYFAKINSLIGIVMKNKEGASDH